LSPTPPIYPERDVDTLTSSSGSEFGDPVVTGPNPGVVEPVDPQNGAILPFNASGQQVNYNVVDYLVPAYPERDPDTLLPIPGGSYVIPEVGGFPIDVVNPADDQQAEVDITMLPGVPGQRGPRGPKGPPGDGAMQYTQSGAATIWNISHQLGFKPNIRVQDSAGTDIEGDVHYNSNNELQINFSRAVSGVAYLS
jgi:hypothetical protein